MSNEEAILVLQNDAYVLYEDDMPYDRQAYYMAIKALEEKRIKTNADRIRSMTDEEFANWYFDKFFPCVPYCSMLQDGCPEHDDCKICLLEWLKRESEGE